MAKLVSSWYDGGSLPENYHISPEKRPGNVIVPICTTIPVIDLAKAADSGRAETIQQIIQAGQEYGFFQVINHGVANTLMKDALTVCKEIFEMPMEDKAAMYSEDISTKGCRLYTSSILKHETQYWRDILAIPCCPLEDSMKLWPDKPTLFREVMEKYTVESKKLGVRILDLISEGLGLEPEYFRHELSKVQNMTVNHYPPCPDPSLTLGIHSHCDVNLLTVLFQGDVYGLQVLKDGQWVGVEPIPDAFVINIGSPLQIISNGNLKSAEHRGVTNSRKARTSIGYFITPSNETVIEPAKAIIDSYGLPIYRSFPFIDMTLNYAAHKGDQEKLLEHYKIKS